MIKYSDFRCVIALYFVSFFYEHPVFLILPFLFLEIEGEEELCEQCSDDEKATFTGETICTGY